MQGEQPSMFKPALISGAAFGVAGAIPVVNWINCACCALIIGAGFLAAYLFSRQSKAAGTEFRPGAGAQVGLMAGLVYGVVTSVVSIILNAAFGLGDWQQALQELRQMGTVNPETMQQIAHFMETTGPTVIALFGVFVSLLFGAIFGTVGGLIGGSLFKVVPPQSADQEPGVPPPPPPVQPGG